MFHARFKKLTNKTVIEFKKENNIESTIESNLHKLRETFNKKGDSIGYGILSEENIHLLAIQKFENIDKFLDTYHVTRKLYYGGLLKYSIQKGIECNK